MSVHLSNFLSNPWMVFLTINLVLLLIFTFLNLDNFRKLFTDVSKRTWIVLGLVFLFGFALFNQFYFFGTHTDGYNFIEASKGILETGHYFYRCDAGAVGNCLSYSKHTSPPGASFLISLVFLAVGGINSYYALALSGILMSLSVVLVFLVSYLAFERERLALYASFIYSTIPVLVLWAGTGHMRPFGLFFVLLSLLSFLSAVRLDDKRMWLLTVFSTSFAVYILKAFLLLIPLYLLFFAWKKRGDLREHLMPDRLNEYSMTAGIATLMFLPILKWMLVYEPTMMWENPKFSLEYLVPQGLGLLLMYFGELTYPLLSTRYYIPIISLLAFGYFLYVSRKRNAEYFLIGGIFLSLFLVYSTYLIHGFHSMDQTYSLDPLRVFIPKDFIRHAIALTPFYAIMAAFSLSKIEEAIDKVVPRSRHLAPVVLVLLVAISGLSLPNGLFQDRRASGPLNQEKFELVNMTPDDAFIISSDHLIVQSDALRNNSRESLDIWRYNGLKDEMYTLLDRHPDTSYVMMQGCDRRRFRKFCQEIKKNYSLEPVAERRSISLYHLVKDSRRSNAS